MSSVGSPILGVKRSLFRIHDPMREEADEAFRKIRGSVLARDKFICRFCRMSTQPAPDRPGGYFTVHHINDDHHDSRMENLATACPFCHQVFHAGMAARGNEPGIAIWLPQIGQFELNRYCHVLFAFMEMAEDKDLKIKDLDVLVQKAETIYHALQDAKADLKRIFGEQAPDLKKLAGCIAKLPEGLYAAREKALGGVRILPIRDAYRTEIRFWAERHRKNLPLSTWETLLKNALDRMIRGGNEKGVG